jgi:predicted RNA binding protein YcfA (HicA-like mRNA interferase family)
MRQSAANWTRDDLDQLYLGFGFELRQGGKHDVAKHPDYPQLRATLPRHATSLAKAYIRTAVKLIDELERLKAEEGFEE